MDHTKEFLAKNPELHAKLVETLGREPSDMEVVVAMATSTYVVDTLRTQVDERITERDKEARELLGRMFSPAEVDRMMKGAHGSSQDFS